MRIIIAFIVAFGIGAGSRWTGVPSLAPQAIIGALLIVAMSTGYVSADRLLKRTSSPSAAVSVSKGATDKLGAHGREAIAHESPATPEPEADTAFWRQRSEALQLIVADLLRTNQQLRASGNAQTSQGDGPVTLHLGLQNKSGDWR
jgi:XapX domain-containing protein